MLYVNTMIIGLFYLICFCFCLGFGLICFVLLMKFYILCEYIFSCEMYFCFVLFCFVLFVARLILIVDLFRVLSQLYTKKRNGKRELHETHNENLLSSTCCFVFCLFCFDFQPFGQQLLFIYFVFVSLCSRSLIGFC